MTKKSEYRFHHDADDRGLTGDRTCTCGKQHHDADTFDRDATIAKLIAQGHTHIDWTKMSDAYVEEYDAEMERTRARVAAVATVPPAAQPAPMRADTADHDPSKPFANGALEGRARRIAQQRTPLGQKPDVDAMFSARREVIEFENESAATPASLRNMSSAVAAIRAKNPPGNK